jgi:hypothetical protein
LPVKVVIVDASPLITLAAADALDYLFHFHAPVIIPDAVFHEATTSAGKLGAAEILDWAWMHSARVSVMPTQAFHTEMELRENQPRRLSRDLGEWAAIEIIRHSGTVDPNEPVVFLSDDKEVARMIVNDPVLTLLLSTWDFLVLLEETARIQSADAVRNAVIAKGRNPPRGDIFANTLPAAKDFLLNILNKTP